MKQKVSVKTVAVVAVIALVAIGMIAGSVWWILSGGRNKTTQPENLTAIKGWGDDTGGRRAYTLDEIMGDELGDRVVLNSMIHDGEDERQFMSVMALEDGLMNIPRVKDNGMMAVKVQEGTYGLLISVKNDNPGTVSENTRVGFQIPTTRGTELNASGWVFSDNAEAKEMWHEITLECDRQFHLEYAYGNAAMYWDNLGELEMIPLGDEIVTKLSSENGVQVGENGQLGFHASEEGLVETVYAVITVKVVYDDTSIEADDAAVDAAGASTGADATAEPTDAGDLPTEIDNAEESEGEPETVEPEDNDAAKDETESAVGGYVEDSTVKR